MQTGRTASGKSRTCRRVLCLFLSFFLFISLPCYAALQADGTASVQTGKNAAGIARQVLTLIEAGQWDTAYSRLNQEAIESHETLETLQRILNAYQVLEKARTERQQEAFTKRAEKLSGYFNRMAENDPNLSFQTVLKQAQNVWKDATKAQRKELAAQKSFSVLMNHAYRKATEFYAKGQWSKSYSAGVRWLMTFEPENSAYRDLDKKLKEANTILGFLKADPCEDKNERYTPIQRQTVHQVFLILEGSYVKPVDFGKMADGMLNRCVVLADVLKTAPPNLVLPVEPNDVAVWAEHFESSSAHFTKERQGEFNRQELEDLLDALLGLNEKTLKLPDGFLLAMMTNAALAELDSYTNAVWPFAVKNFDKAMTGQFGGVGIHIKKERSGIRVLSLIPDTPAMRAGLQADALIVAVDGERTKGMSATCAVRKISGPVGTPVTLTLRYPGSETEQLLTIVRDKIVMPAVEGSRQANIEKTKSHWDYFLDQENHIGYLRLKNFTDRTVPQAKAALKKMEGEGLAGLILDVRGNGGGLLTAAVQVSDLFVDTGVLLISRGRSGVFNEWFATKNKVERSYPLVVLVDGGSASASEIVAGVLRAQSNRSVVLVGTRSYGKGSVQEVVSLGPDKGKLKFTSAYYYLPDGEPVKNREVIQQAGRDDWGIAPDIEVPLYSFERREIQQVNAARTKISNTDPAQENEQEDSISEKMLSVDPQLATALLVLKAEIAVGR